MHFVCLAITALEDKEFMRYLEYGEKRLLLTGTDFNFTCIITKLV